MHVYHGQHNPNTGVREEEETMKEIAPVFDGGLLERAKLEENSAFPVHGFLKCLNIFNEEHELVSVSLKQ